MPDMAEPRDDRITVRGRAEREVEPDVAAWSFVVVERGGDAAAAFAACSERLAALVERLRGQEGELSTGPVSVAPEHDQHGRPTATVQASGVVRLDVPVAAAGAAAGAAMGAGADRLHGPGLRVRDVEAVRAGLAAEAVAAARRKARDMAAAADRRLGPVLAVYEGAREWQPGDDGRYAVAQMAAADSVEPPVVPGARRISADVTVVIALEPAA